VGAALALPLGAVLISYGSGADPRLDAPAEVRIGGQPAPPDVVRAPVVFEQPAEIRTAPDPLSPPGPAMVPVPPPAAAVKSAPAKAKGKSRSGNGVNPPGRGRVSAGNG
jgi:hypothetical protein